MLTKYKDVRRLGKKGVKNLLTVTASLVRFELFSGKVCLNCWLLILSVSPNMMHFVRSFSIMRAWRKAYCYGRGSKLWKNFIDPKHC